MRNIYITLLLCLSVLSANAQSSTILIVEGNYQGKNLFVQNPFRSNNVGFCTIKVLVNDNVTTDEISSSAYEIDLSLHKLNVGDAVVVKIEHSLDCTPKVLNSEVLRPKSSFDVVSYDIDSKGKMTFKTTNEQGKLTYTIEAYIWNKWVPVGEVDGVGTSGEHEYEFQLSPHSGENKVRFKQVDYTNKARYSQPKTFTDATVKEVDFTPKKVSGIIKFVEMGTETKVKTRFEIYDSYGNVVKKGYSDEIDCSALKAGAYYINFDSKDSQFIKK
jgi:hypothetical protein